MKKSMILCLVALRCGVPCEAQETPRLAVFDPQVSLSGRFRMDVGEMNAVAQTLQNAGWGVSRVTAEQIDDATVFNAHTFDVLVLRGDAVVRENFPQLKQFARDGGVVVALAAKSPFGTAVAKTAKGSWTVSPEAPQFAWQTPEIADLYGIRYTYRPAMVDSGIRHTATPLFKRYLPAAADYTGPLSSTWIYPIEGGEFFPLVRSQRGDGRDVTPQVYIARKEGRSAVISSADFWTKGGDGWSQGAQTTVAMVRIALDLKSGALRPVAADKVEIPADLPPAEPLTSRLPTGEVNPDDAPVVTRWGKFNGSGLELDEKMPGHSSILPRVLVAGASVDLPLTQNGKGLWLRVRGAVSQTGAALKVVTGGRTLWNESIAYAEVSDVGNFGTLSLSSVAVEFNRRVFLPPTDAASVEVSNPGTQPLYFDAVQLENDPVKPVRWLTGMGAAWKQIILGGPVNQPRNLTREWTGLRSTLWGQDIGAPGDPNRWKHMEERFKGYQASGAPLEFLIEGTPQWAAGSPERYAAADRKRAVPPDPEKYREVVDYVLKNHAADILRYEIWNEEDSAHYWLGSAKEFVQLWRTIVPMIRRGAPGAEVTVGGLTGFDKTFLETLSREGVLKEADLLGFHPYAGAEAAWDKPFGTFQGQVYSLGENLPIYCNEMGFPIDKSDWFTQAKFPYNEATQARMTDVALARLLASGVSMFSIFLSGGEEGGLSYINSKGQPRPAYVVLQDYFKLGRDGGRRFDVSMCRADGTSQTGVYLAGSQHADDSITVVVNPAEVVPPKFDAAPDAPAPVISVPLVLRLPLSKKANWKARIDGGEVPMEIHGANDQPWGEITFDLKKRVVLTVTH